MEIVILSARVATPSNRRLLEASQRRGLECRVVDACRVVATTGQGLRLDGGEALSPPPEVVIARVGNWRPDSVLAALETVVSEGAATPNPAAAIRCGRDHWRTVQALSTAGLPVPASAAGADPETLADHAAARLAFPVVVKQRRSRMGVGAIRCDAPDHLEAVLDSLWRLGDEVLVQQWHDTGGESIRIAVVAGRVVAAARFRAAGDEWRSNVARGGDARATDLDSDAARLARRAAACLGLGVCGVDLLPTRSGLLVLEVNPTPGFLALEHATGADVAGAVVEHAAELGGSATRR